MRLFWEQELTPEREEELIGRLAKEIKKRKMEAAAILVIESHKPLANLVGHGMVATSPFLAPFLGFDNVDDYSQVLGNRQALDRLILKLEDSSENDEVEVNAMD